MADKSKADKIMEVSLKKAIFYPSSEIHGSVAGFYDYGSTGFRIKKKLEDYWRDFLLSKDNFTEIDTALIMPESVFRASGHLENFNDPMAVCTNKKCRHAERADHILEDNLDEKFEGISVKDLDKLIKKHGFTCSNCGSDFEEINDKNLMFDLDVGSSGSGFLRPETAQGPFVSFKREYYAQREKLPLGIASIGKAFRNEISPRQGLFRQREFTQAELQIFFDPKETNESRYEDVKNTEINILTEDGKEKTIKISELEDKYPKFHLYYLSRHWNFAKSILPEDKLRYRELNEEERAFYNEMHLDLEFYFDSYEEYKEIAGFHYRTDHDLKGHEEVSGQKIKVTRNGEKMIPHVLELSFGVDRIFYSLLDAWYRENDDRTYFAFPSFLAPYTAGIYPLVSKDGLDEKAKEIHDSLNLDVIFDDGGSIGKRYARADEIGIPFGITIDYDTMDDNTVTIRERDSTDQIRVDVDSLNGILESLSSGDKTLSDFDNN